MLGNENEFCCLRNTFFVSTEWQEEEVTGCENLQVLKKEPAFLPVVKPKLFLEVREP